MAAFLVHAIFQVCLALFAKSQHFKSKVKLLLLWTRQLRGYEIAFEVHLPSLSVVLDNTPKPQKSEPLEKLMSLGRRGSSFWGKGKLPVVSHQARQKNEYWVKWLLIPSGLYSLAVSLSRCVTRCDHEITYFFLQTKSCVCFFSRRKKSSVG